MTKHARGWLGILLALVLLIALYWTWAEGGNPLDQPSAGPAAAPTTEPTTEPTPEPTAEPTAQPTPQPTAAPADDADEPEPTEELSEDQLGEALEKENIVLDGLGEGDLAAIEGKRNILLAGLDARPGQKNGRSDTMMILTLDADDNAIKLTSLMRDMYVDIPGKGGNRLNAAWVYGGPKLLMKTIERNFGVKIDQYVAVDFSMLADVIDQLGGLTLTVDTKAQMKAINGVIQMDNKVLGKKTKDGFVTKLGSQKMTGKQAQAYARYRKVGGDDFGRTERQREVVMKCIGRVGELSTFRLAKLAAANIGKVRTNLSLADALALVPAALKLDGSVKQLRIPADGTYASKTVSGMSVLVPNLKKNRRLLADFIGS
ncbi:MAG: LCP family protein [Clostridiales bacterium]|nr:LCP family protein [Clostridiales bacterium]